MVWRRLFRFLRTLLYFSIFSVSFSPEWPTYGDEKYQIRTVIDLREFDFLTWLTNASLVKSEAVLAREHTYLDEASQSQFVLNFLDVMTEIQQLESEIQRIYIDPDIQDPNEATTDLQKRLSAKRDYLAQIQPLAEAIVQFQVGTILVEDGFGIAGHPWPPVLMHMSPLPSLMIVSARDRIERLSSFSLVNGLTTPVKDEMETAVLTTVDQSALIVPIGGMGTYPAMIMETSNINWLVEVTAHEWSHHWMSFYPVGTNYIIDPQIRIINETVASTIDREIAAQVIERYYPKFVPSPPPPAPTVTEVPTEPEEPPAFDFRAEMAETRVTVDRMLANGDVEGAELYMEIRRRIFVDNGYAIRKLNQAYFAFYGAYAAEPGGASAGDPIGPLVGKIRDNSASLRVFMDNMGQVGSFQELEALAATLYSNSNKTN
ncbi:MAG: hypothetical protein GY943_24390 [Chloroflexi bacterium]|nr:hypothetical protein [Chloroflexota bacterium]